MTTTPPAAQQSAETSALRLPVPASQDVATLRGCVDRSLMLIGHDAHEKYAGGLERAYGPEWPGALVGSVGPGRSPERLDPAFWLSELVRPDSPARATPALQQLPPGFARRLAEARGVRNAHSHFAPGSDDPTEVVRRLRVLVLAAQSLRLRCASEIRAVADALETVTGGTAQPPMTIAQATERAAGVERAAAQEERAAAQAAEQAERADAAEEEVSRLRALLDVERHAAADDREEHARRLACAEQEAAGHRREADVATRRLQDLEAHRRELEQQQTAATVLPPTIGEALAHAYALGIGCMTQLEARPPGSSVEDERMTAMARDVAERLRRMCEAVGVPDVHVCRLPDPAHLQVRDLRDHAAAVEALSATRGWETEVAELDEESKAASAGLLDLAPSLLRVAEALLGDGTPRVHSEQGPQVIEPGDPWPYPRGHGAWVLSAQRRSLRPHRSASAVALPGEVERECVDAFLQVRPEGGRVFVDDDGDASTYLDGELVYLGSVGWS